MGNRIAMTAMLIALLLAAPSRAEETGSGASRGTQPPAGGLGAELDAVLRAPAPAPEAQPPGGDLGSELDAVLHAPAASSAPAAPVANASAPQAANGAAPTSTGLLNPDLGLVFDGTTGGSNRPPVGSSGDDPLFFGPPDHRNGGFTLQELELSYAANVDPYLTAKAFLTIANLTAVEVEEGYGLTTALPAGLQVKAGVFRSAAGRQNEQHLHAQDFSTRPLMNAAYLGLDGLRPPGAQLSWLAPTPFFLQLAAELSSVTPWTSPTFGGSLRSSPTWLGNVQTFLTMGRAWSLLVGATAAGGHAPAADGVAGSELQSDGPRSLLGGADLYLKYSPLNQVRSWVNLAVQAEYFVRRIAGQADSADGAQVDGGGYVQAVSRLARRWHVGGRFDLLGLPASARQGRDGRVTAMVAFEPSEFSRVRLQASQQRPAGTTPVYQALLLLEYSIGAHGAHPY